MNQSENQSALKKIEALKALFNFNAHLLWEPRKNQSEVIYQLVSFNSMTKTSANQFFNLLTMLSGKKSSFIVESRTQPGSYRLVINLDEIDDYKLKIMNKNKYRFLTKLGEFLTELNWPGKKLGHWYVDNKGEVIFKPSIKADIQYLKDELDHGLQCAIDEHCKRYLLDSKKLNKDVDTSCYQSLLRQNIQGRIIIKSNNTFELVLSLEILPILRLMHKKLKHDQYQHDAIAYKVMEIEPSRLQQDMIDAVINFYLEDIEESCF